MAVLIRLLLVILTFVLIIVLSQVALVSARTRLERADLPTIAQQAWEGTSDYFTSLATGSLGEASSTSILGGQRRAMGELLLDAYWKSMVLVFLAVGIATVLGVAVGVLAAASRGLRSRGILLTATTLTVSLPSFLIAILLILGGAEVTARFGVRLWPTFGFGIDDHLIVPVIVLAARPFAQIANFAYVATEDVLKLDYIRTARAKGLPRRTVVVRHGLRAALTPIVTIFGIDVGTLIGSTVISEVVFNLRGLGYLSIQSIRQQDLPIILGTTIVAAVALVIANILVDILYAVVDPRVTYS